MKGREFLNRVFEIGKARGVPVRVDLKRGKGSHVTLYYGKSKTVLKDRRKDLPKGLLFAMMRQLGLNRGDFR
ncbi:MAG: type II toxin-antitoxin system HicA family toxin [Gammaproteobacteria bacterium]|nr:type II toxin-antitoxin system HicA family toxin [Gammaproteobacteria bacterium]MXW44898.1 addiction module toxin, HicA family [Gammaproteobacteria bacterium]MYD02934.1 addiction module toxin, HicA family [Gammaproteobacteria bacterium]MYI26013.1 addiction module toxin, HicA family [Gammaproteobacteria bacterium]